jgi:hypothetical protein
MRMDIKISPVAPGGPSLASWRDNKGLAGGAAASGLGDVQEKRVCSRTHARALAGCRAIRVAGMRAVAAWRNHSSINLVAAALRHTGSGHGDPAVPARGSD